jgi:hypothetical protein
MPEKGKRKLAVDLGRAVAEMRNGMNYLLQARLILTFCLMGAGTIMFTLKSHPDNPILFSSASSG